MKREEGTEMRDKERRTEGSREEEESERIGSKKKFRRRFDSQIHLLHITTEYEELIVHTV